MFPFVELKSSCRGSTGQFCAHKKSKNQIFVMSKKGAILVKLGALLSDEESDISA